MRILIGIFIFITAAFVACSEKGRDTVTPPCDYACKNGGYCDNGACSCPRGYEGVDCSKRWLSRYLGTWKIKETVLESSDTARIGKTNNFEFIIKEKDGNPVRFFIDNFSGTDSLDNISCEIGLKFTGGYDLPTNFIFTTKQNIPGSYLSIQKGEGSVNEFGTTMTGEYETSYISNGEMQAERVLFSGTIVL